MAKNSKKTNTTTSTTTNGANKTSQQTTRVLYQNLGGTWYAFTNIGDEIFFAPVNSNQTAAGVENTADTTNTNGQKNRKTEKAA